MDPVKTEDVKTEKNVKTEQDYRGEEDEKNLQKTIKNVSYLKITPI